MAVNVGEQRSLVTCANANRFTRCRGFLSECSTFDKSCQCEQEKEKKAIIMFMFA